MKLSAMAPVPTIALAARIATTDACGGVIFSPSSWKPQEEGMMNIAARFSLSKKPRYVDQERKEPIQLKVMLASLVTLQQGCH
jgi:hypothetical protein